MLLYFNVRSIFFFHVQCTSGSVLGVLMCLHTAVCEGHRHVDPHAQPM